MSLSVGNPGEFVGTYRDLPITGTVVQAGLWSDAAATTAAHDHSRLTNTHTAIRKEANGTWSVLTLHTPNLPEGLTTAQRATLAVIGRNRQTTPQSIEILDFQKESRQLHDEGLAAPNVSFVD